MPVRSLVFALLMVLGGAGVARAQPPPPPVLTCAWCACVDAQRAIEQTRRELRLLAPELRTTGPDLMTAIGGGGALLAVLAGFVATAYVSFDQSQEPEGFVRRTWISVAGVAALHLTVFIGGLGWRVSMVRQQADARQRFRELGALSKQQRRYAREICGR